MKKKVAVAMAITAGLCFVGGGHLKPAFAGHWEEVPNSHSDPWGYPPDQSDPEYQDWVEEQGERLDGTVSYSSDDYYTGTAQHFESSHEWDESHEEFAGFAPDTVWTVAYGGAININDVGKRKTKFKWVPDVDPITGLPDPNDNPPDLLILKISASANGNACSDTTNQVHDVTKESVTVSLMGESGGDETSWTRIGGAIFKRVSISAKKLFVIPTNGHVEVDGP